MAREKSSRKYQITINNPIEKGYTHDKIKSILLEKSNVVYFCLSDEIGNESGTYHTHIYVVFKNSVMFSTIKNLFYGSHLEDVKGNNQENYEYITKTGKWSGTDKKETNLKDTFEEYGTLPKDRTAKGNSLSEEIYEMIKNGCTNAEILESYPTAMSKIQYIDKTRETLTFEKHKNEFRKLQITYIYGTTGSGKTRYVMEKYGYTNVYRITDYDHPFDDYNGEDVVIFEEFRSSLKIEDMLKYLDGYPLKLPCRYSNKTACFTKIYIITNIALKNQYTNIQCDQKETWLAFKRRIDSIEHYTDDFIEFE